MREEEKQKYLEGYRKAKEKGVPFFPDILFKDAVVSLFVFLILIALAYFIGAPLEARADPADTSYTPRPEWYFLFLFQLLKYFPGRLEVIGVVVLPTLVILVLFLLPFLDRSPRRHFANRPVILGISTLAIVGIALLTIQAYREAPPPTEAVVGDQTAALYTKNCAGCHGASIQVPAGTNLHAVIAEGKHEGMPAWSADLTSDQIDALAGFILSPGGSKLFTENCGKCHQAAALVAGNPLELKNALEQGPDYPTHNGLEIPVWKETLRPEERTALLNFLVAPDGQRLFATNCSPCHGRAIEFSGSEEDLRAIIAKGGLHLEMPPWREKLNEAELTSLANFVVNPAASPDGKNLFNQFCSECHGERVPRASSIEQARQAIASGGPHETMPVWGQVLTAEQLDALVSYTLSTAKGNPLEEGRNLFSQSCSACHGDFGEGGPNPTRPGDIIAPISTAEFLKTRDDFTLRAIISQGQPNFGMSPFGSSFGGPLEDKDIEAIVAYIRSWEANPPVEFPPQVVTTTISVNGADIYKDLCSQCHGAEGEGGLGPSLRSPQFQSANTDQEIYNSIDKGHEATPMIGWGKILTPDQIQQLVDFIRHMEPGVTIPGPTPTKESSQTKPAPTPTESGQTTSAPTPTPEAGAPSFTADVLPIFQAKCKMCHGQMGGWDAKDYDTVMNSGDHAPVIIPGDPANSLLAQKLLGSQKEGTAMPPNGLLPQEEVQVILDWIEAGATEK